MGFSLAVTPVATSLLYFSRSALCLRGSTGIPRQIFWCICLNKEEWVGEVLPVLHKTRPDHPPNTGNISLPERGTVASEVDGSERCAGQIGADEDALDVDGAAFELGGLKGNYDCDAALSEGGLSAIIFSFFFFSGNEETQCRNVCA